MKPAYCISRELHDATCSVDSVVCVWTISKDVKPVTRGVGGDGVVSDQRRRPPPSCVNVPAEIDLGRGVSSC